tara:strand:+ start:258 stop:527 length:270 start_codon:yes stop_codon:yes gene_type:complete
MLKAMVAKKGLDLILKKVMEKREIKKLRKYVEEDNELDIQMKQLQKTVAKQGKQLEQNDIEIANLKKDSHPPQEYVCCKECGCKIAKIK